MATRSFTNRKDILAARQALQPVRERGWLGGFSNMLGKELGEWFGTRRWLWQVIIWVSLINGLMAFVLFVVPKIDPNGLQVSEGVSAGPDSLMMMGLTLYFSMAVIAGSIGTMILAQDEVIREKQSGTAAWILSKPVSRASFLLTKLLSNIAGVLVFIVALPGLIAYAEIALVAGRLAAPLPFLVGAGVVLLTLVFYIALVIMLGVLFEQRGPLLGISFGVMFGGLILSSFLPQLAYVLPLNMDKISVAVAQGQELPAVAISQIISTAVLSVLFTLIALWRFRREEF
jgi:ABC-2 type transport system permease protein